MCYIGIIAWKFVRLEMSLIFKRSKKRKPGLFLFFVLNTLFSILYLSEFSEKNKEKLNEA